MAQRVRDLRLDLVRICALFFVVGVHFFLQSNFYLEGVVAGKSMIVALLARSLFIICVPLFIILTGYLQNQVTPSKKYYLKIFKILLTYLICAVIYESFLAWYDKEPLTMDCFIRSLLEFSRYSWYVNMYIGLFFLIPFLNLVFNNLGTKRARKALLIILFCLIGLPSIVNIFDMKIIPDWWIKIYPFFYYYLGAYLSKYPIKISTLRSLGYIVLLILFNGFFDYFYSRGGMYQVGTWNSYNSGTVMILSLLVFNLFINLKKVKYSAKMTKLITILSNACFAAYLISVIFDTIFYTILIDSFPDMHQRLLYMPVIVLCSFVCSLASGVFIVFLQDTITKMFGLMKRTIKELSSSTPPTNKTD